MNAIRSEWTHTTYLYMYTNCYCMFQCFLVIDQGGIVIMIFWYKKSINL